MRKARFHSVTTTSAAVLALMLLPQAAAAQSAAPGGDGAPDAGTAEEIVVSGFRASLDSALARKKLETAAVDSIVSEDIGKFPDSNLAESMQRIPGVALSRGDGGEGKSISVRGLGPAFTRVRINGMEGVSQTGNSDIFFTGSTRTFEFNVFPTEIFSDLAVRKTPSADVEEGSLGATVDLKAPKPLTGRDDFTATLTARGVYAMSGARSIPASRRWCPRSSPTGPSGSSPRSHTTSGAPATSAIRP